MAYVAPDPTPYQSTLVPITSRTLTIKRGDGTTAGGGTPTTVGTFLAENCAISKPGKAIRRSGTSGEDTDISVVRLAHNWSSKLQIANTTTNTPQVGDFFEEAYDIATNTPSALLHRFVIVSIDKDEASGSAHTWNMNATEDKENSTYYV
jgi:hypothetical protein